MSGERVERRLTAIVAADIAGYSRLMGKDEAGTLARLKALRRKLIDPEITEHKGRVVKTTGDGMLIEFPSVVGAVACALAVQKGMAAHNTAIPEGERIEFRLGINLGDVIVEGDDIHGDGVNVAARLEGLAEPGGICVSAIVHDQVRDRLDCRFEDLGEQSLKNIARPMRVYRVRADRAATAPAGGPELTLPDKPSIAVLPFQNLSGDPEQEYFADGMVEEIITALSRIRWLFVIARNSSFTYKGQAIDVKRVGRALGVRYVLEGSVRKAGGRVRITAQLIEAESGAHLWADRFDGSLEDVFDLQDQVATSVGGVIEPTVQAAEIRRALSRPTTDLTTYDLYLRALSEPVSREGILRRLSLLDEAISRDPRYAPALGYAAVCHVALHAAGWAEDAEASRRAACALAGRAVELVRDDPTVLSAAAYALGYSGEDIEAAVALIDHSLELNPGFVDGWFRSGWLRLWAGDSERAIDHFEKAMRLNPRDRRADALLGIGVGHFFARRFEVAKAMLAASLHENPSWAPPYRFLAACCAQMGRLDEARDVVKRLRAITPVVVPRAEHWRNLENRELYLSGLRLAAGEEP